MTIHLSSRFAKVALGIVGAAASAALAVGAAAAPAHAGHGHGHGHGHHQTEKPTVVLVHGAWADSSGWGGVITRLEKDGYPVIAVANPLRGLDSDAAYVRSVVDSIDGDVVLVGHSYGGGVITNAATGADNVNALVYIAAFGPDEGETLEQYNDPAEFPGTALKDDSLILRPYPGGVDTTIAQDQFREIFAADLPADQAAIMAATQRPADVGVLDDETGVPAWKSIPSWYQISTQDKALSPVAQRLFAERMGATTTSIKASHAGYVSHPVETTRVIERAAEATD